MPLAGTLSGSADMLTAVMICNQGKVFSKLDSGLDLQVVGDGEISLILGLKVLTTHEVVDESQR